MTNLEKYVQDRLEKMVTEQFDETELFAAIDILLDHAVGEALDYENLAARLLSETSISPYRIASDLAQDMASACL